MKKAVVLVSALALLLSSALFVASASADEAADVSAVAVVDALNRVESPLSNSGKWSALNWSEGTSKTGRDTTTGWGPLEAFSTINGAYWSAQASDAGGGDAAGVTLNASPELTERYVSVWLNMPNPGGAKSGYQLRWTLTAANTYTVKLSKWVSGTETVLASEAGVSIPTGTRMMISDNGNTITAWKGASSPLTSILTATDSTYTSGYAGIEASGNISRSLDFRVGNFSQAKLTGLALRDNLHRSEVPLATAQWSKPTWATTIGGVWNNPSPGWIGYGTSGPETSAAYWNPTTFSDANGGDGASLTITVAPGTGEYEAVLLNLPNPGSVQSGYEARWTRESGGNYNLELAKWASGVRSVLASKAEAVIPVGSTVALTAKGGNLVVWTGSSTLTPTLFAGDSTYSSGYAGMQVAGGQPTADNFRAGPLDPVPAKPTGLSVSPASPANNNSPAIKGTADAGSTVQLFTNSSCSGTPVATGTAAAFASPGITVTVADNTTTTFYTNATNSNGASPCSSGVTYVEDSAAPAAPTVSSTSPASPANNNSPKVIGSAESGSAVKVYTNNTCTSTVAATGTAIAFSFGGLAVSVADNTTTTFYATATDAAGNVSACSSTSVKYEEDSTPPAAPTVSSTSPASGANNNEPKVIGSAAAGSTVKVYTNNTCTSTVAATGTAAAFASPGLTVSVADNSTTTFYATATDSAGNVSSCSTTSVKYEEATPKIYWGAWLGGNAYSTAEKTYGDGPWDQETWNLFEEHAGKKISIEHFGQPAPWNQAFAEAPLKYSRERGAIPLMDMDPDGVTHKEIIEGKKDSYFKTWATAVKNYGYPMMFRWEWEMNGTWFQWGKEAAENPTLFKEVWQHLHKLFEEQGATNITWVWCPNLSFTGSTSLTSLYPGDEYVDWTCLDGYNFGTNPAKPDSWKSFSTLYTNSYNELLSLAPNKPIMIGEMSSSEYGGEKSAWITDAIGTQIPKNFPKIKAVVWFNKWDSGKDWPIETSTAAQTAFKNAIANPIYATNTFGNLTKLTKVEPLP